MAVGSVPFARAVLKGAGVNPKTDVQWLAVELGAPAANALRKKDIDAFAAWDTAVASLENAGLKFNYINPPWLNDIMGNVIIASESTVAKHPDWVVKVTRGIAMASLFGLTNPEAAIHMHWKLYPQTKPQTVTEKTLEKAKHVFNSRFDLLKLGSDEKWGENIASQWQFTAKMATDEKLVPAGLDVKSAYTNRFIDEVNKFDKNAVIEKAKKSD